jgi:hypothetical protein
MNTPTVTAVGRILKLKGDEPRILHRITVSLSGLVRTVVRQVLP